jgi:sec-independent protein translocase protein TatA
MFPNLGPMEMIIVMGVAVLLFGKRLPEVGRSLGKGIVEFKKGLRGIEDELDISGPPSHYNAHRSESAARTSDSSETSVPKFEPPTSAPVSQMDYAPQPAED